MFVANEQIEPYLARRAALPATDLLFYHAKNFCDRRGERGVLAQLYSGCVSEAEFARLHGALYGH